MIKDITRIDTNARASRIVIHGDTVYLAGVTSPGEGIQAQMRAVLAQVDGYLAQGGTDKSRLLSVQIWLRDIDRDFDGMNVVWGEWAPREAMPTRATCEAKLAGTDLLVEVVVTAARR